MSVINIETDEVFDDVHSDLVDSLEKHCPDGQDLAEWSLDTVEKLYMLTQAQNTLVALRGVQDFGREHGATYCALVINDETYEDPSHLLSWPVFFDANCEPMGDKLDASDHEDDLRIHDWITSNREEWIVRTLVLDLSDPQIQSKVGHDYVLDCAKTTA